MCYLFDKWIKYKTLELIDTTGRKDIGVYLEMMRWIDAKRRCVYPDIYSFYSKFSNDYYPESIYNYNIN